MSLDANNNSLNSNNPYESMLRLYRASRSSSAEEIQGQFAALPMQFRNQIFGQLADYRGERLAKKRTDMEVLQNLPAMQHAIQRIALQDILSVPESFNERIRYVCNENEVQNLTEAYLICLRDYGQDEELEILLNTWVAEGDPEENREEAKQKILNFRFDPTSSALFLANLRLKTLPHIFHRQPFIDRLEKLNLPNNQLETLPPGIHHLQNLTFLTLSNNQFSEFPEEICELKKLKILTLSQNNFIDLPENISNLQNLKYLAAMNTLLTDFPCGIFRLPSDCHIDFSQTLISDRDITELEVFRNSPEYQGPLNLSYSQKDEGSLFELNQFLRNSFPDPRLILKYLPNLIDDPETHLIPREWPQEISPNKHLILIAWLERISYSRDYAESNPQTIDRVASSMHLAQLHPFFREKFWEIIEEATTDCGDRGALSLLRLGRWKKIVNANPQDIKEFAKVVASNWSLEMLDRIAAHKLERIRKNDPYFKEDTQVFLEYPLKLKAPLALDIDVESNYFSVYSRVTQADLDQAEAFVKRLESNLREKCRFLFDEKLWFKAFEEAYPEEVKGIEEYIGWKTEKLDGNENSTKEDYDNLSNLRKEIFIALIASKLDLEIPELPLEEIVDWETQLHSTFGIINEPAIANSASTGLAETL